MLEKFEQRNHIYDTIRKCTLDNRRAVSARKKPARKSAILLRHGINARKPQNILRFRTENRTKNSKTVRTENQQSAKENRTETSKHYPRRRTRTENQQSFSARKTAMKPLNVIRAEKPARKTARKSAEPRPRKTALRWHPCHKIKN
jgi:hypothetical protein